MPTERRRVYYSGRVQGVGFRATAHSLAQAHNIAGFVRNLDDGRVELVAEGEGSDVDNFLAAIQAAFGRRIRQVDSNVESPGDSPYPDFSIRY
jgi:acylphosphatase